MLVPIVYFYYLVKAEGPGDACVAWARAVLTALGERGARSC